MCRTIWGDRVWCLHQMVSCVSASGSDLGLPVTQHRKSSALWFLLCPSFFPSRMWALARDLRASETRITAGIPWLTAWAHLRLLSIGMEQDPKPSYVSVCLQGFSCTFLFPLVSLPLFLLSLQILSHLSTALYLQDLLFSPKGPFPILLSCYF